MRYVASIVAATLGLKACHPAQQPNQDELIAEFARDTTIIEQPDRGPELEALDRMLGRIGIPFDQRLADDRSECLLMGKQILQGPRITCRIRAGEPLELQVVADSDGYQELQVLQGSQIAQRIDLTEFERPDTAAPALYAEDLDGDGARELIMQRFAGATGNSGYTVWRVDPVAHHLTADSAMSAMPGLIRMSGRPCVLQSWNMSVHDHESVIECFLNGRWRVVWASSTQSMRPSRGIARQLSVMIGDTLRLIRADTIPNPD